MIKKKKFSLIRLVILLFFGSLVLGQFQRLQITPQIALYLHDIFLGVIYLLALRYIKKPAKIPKKYHLLIKSFIFFLISLIISLLLWVSSKEINVVLGSLYLFRFIYYSLIFPTFYILRKNKVITKNLLYSLLAVGVGLMLTGLIQRIFVPDTRNFTLLGWDNHLYRSIGSLLDPNFLGLLLVLTLVISKQLKFKHKTAVIGLLLFTLLLTYSRSSYVAFIIAVITLGIVQANKKIISYSIGIIIIGALLLPRPGGEGIKLERTASIFTRLESQRKSLQIFSSHPVFGIGFNNYKAFVSNSVKYDFVPSHPSGPDNSFLLILITTGIIGSTSFLVFAYYLLKAFKKNPVIIPSIMAIATHSMFNNSLFYPWILIWMFILLSENTLRERI